MLPYSWGGKMSTVHSQQTLHVKKMAEKCYWSYIYMCFFVCVVMKRKVIGGWERLYSMFFSAWECSTMIYRDLMNTKILKFCLCPIRIKRYLKIISSRKRLSHLSNYKASGQCFSFFLPLGVLWSFLWGGIGVGRRGCRVISQL